ncbi:hypothetical protein QO010_004746 [Caulobacter ginsengisoli]|uniref:Lytic transglycosylase n=1 Tax=Caulobacter ginsengisoli TaxID=400775 RepID=A0ABU0J0X2_9CAUL|nr:hypothetical protein [Caulobacter ginsengisoli]MDQ0466949.1 hypothetical protein [Caulobacter ginsengisoli]
MINRRHILGLAAAASALSTAALAQTTEDIARLAIQQKGIEPIPVTEAEKAIWRDLLADGTKAQAADAIIARPDSVNPLAFALVSESLWERGDRAKAAFWFYLFQARTQPWMSGGPISEVLLRDYVSQLLDRSVDYVGVRRYYNQRVGEPVNTWAMSDLDALQVLAARVFSYERRIPLYAERITYASEERWLAQVEAKRVENEQTFKEALAQNKPADFYEARRKQGLYVGPWKDPGAPLPEDWR